MLTNNQKQILETEQNIEILKQRKERYEYLGILSEYQTQPANIIQRLDYTKLNPQQHLMFKRVLHGLKVYTPEELENLHWDKKRRIKKVWQRGQREVNAWKQVICNKYAQKIFSFFKSTDTGLYLNSLPIDDIDPAYINTMTLKELGINYDDLILFYMHKGLLPKNFLTIK
jgi:hypothetical protein